MNVKIGERNKMQKIFYIFRHGETDLNQQKRWQGSGMNYDLNSTGIEQAEQAVDKFRNNGIEIIFSSPLKRALHTAEIIGKELVVPVKIEDDLRECFYGEAEGKLIVDLERDVPEIVNNWYNPKYWNISFPKGERKIDALNRVLKVLEKLTTENYMVMGVAIHGGTMGALLNHFGMSFDKIPNCGAFKLVYDDKLGWFIDGAIF